MSIETPTNYPLSWPKGWPRHKGARERAHFGKRTRVPEQSWVSKKQLTTHQALARLRSEVCAFTRNGHPWRIDPDRMVISTDLKVRLDGVPRADQKDPLDPGVAVYFKFDDKPVVLACDKWDRVADNIAAIASHLGALRGQERWGVGRLAQAFAGYTALPAPGQTSAATWWVVLGVAHNATFEQIRDAFREKARTAHPDNGGSHEAMSQINAAWDQARKAFQNEPGK